MSKEVNMEQWSGLEVRNEERKMLINVKSQEMRNEICIAEG